MVADPESPPTVVNKNSNSVEHRNGPAKTIGNYTLQQSLGKGSMGKVKLGVHSVTGEKVLFKSSYADLTCVIDCGQNRASS